MVGPAAISMHSCPGITRAERSQLAAYSQLYRWRRELLGSDEAGLAAPVDPQSVAPDPDPVVEIDIDGIVVRVGRHVEEAHLQRVIRAVRSA